MLPHPQLFKTAGTGGNQPITIAIAGAGIGACGSAAGSRIGVEQPPEAGRVGDVAGQGEIFFTERLGCSFVAGVLGGHGSQLGSADKRLPGQDAARQQAEDNEDDGEFNKGESL